MSDEPVKPVASLAATRFDKSDGVGDVGPRDVLVKALHEYDIADVKPEHVIVIFGLDLERGGSGTRYFQGGDFRYHAQIGLCLEGAAMLRESG